MWRSRGLKRTAPPALDIPLNGAGAPAHRFAGEWIVGQRTFYVSHLFDAEAAVAGVVAVPEGERLFVDR